MTGDVLDLVLGKLEGVRKQGGYWMARCPVPDHADRRASLKVMLGTEQPILVHCFAGCHPADVLAGIGLAVSDISKPRPERAQPVGPAYRYTDERGEVLYEVLRKPGKKFVQRRPDGRGGWIWGLGDTRRVLYRLPKILAAPASECIWVAEGEKDVHALEAAGEIATTNPMGAGKWRPEYSRSLTGRDVLIIADRDQPGRDHAQQVAASLSHMAQFTWIVEAAAGKDAHDHLAAGHGITDFVWWSQ